MKIFALLLVSIAAGLWGLLVGAALCGLGICGGLEITTALLLQVVAYGFCAIVVGAFFGKKVGWIPAAAYCAPIAVIGGVLPATIPEWDRVVAAWACVICVAAAYGLCILLLATINKKTAEPNPLQSQPPGGSA